MTEPTLAGILRQTAGAYPGRLAVVAGDERVTYARFLRDAEGLAAWLGGEGVRPGDRVAVSVRNDYDGALALYGTLLAGALAIPLAAAGSRARRERLLGHCRPAALVDQTGPALRTLARTAPARAVPRSGTDPALVQYTSGSTGEPKGVVHSHESTIAGVEALATVLGLGADDRILVALPITAALGSNHLFAAVLRGATLVLTAPPRLPGSLARTLTDAGITCLPAVPTLLALLARLRRLTAPELRSISTAGAVLPVSVTRRLRELVPGAAIVSMYGQTECRRATWLPPDEIDRRPDSVGVAMPGCDVWLEDEDGRPTTPGAVGELVVRSRSVMLGYLDDPQATRSALREPRGPERVLLTGDLFRTDESGFLTFVGRKDDIVKSRGEKVAPQEVERMLESLGAVLSAGVVGVPDPLLGEAVVAQVVLRPGAEIDELWLRQQCASVLEDAAVPSRIFVRDALPHTATGKLDRHALARLAGERVAAEVAR